MLLIKNGRVIDPAGKTEKIADIVKRKTNVAAEKIVITPLDGGTGENE